MKKIFQLLPVITLSALILTLPACKKQGCTDQTALNYDADAKEDDGSCEYSTETALAIHFNSMVGSENLVYNQEYTVNGRKLKFTRAQFYVSGIHLEKHDGSHLHLEDQYLLVHGGAHEYSIGNVPTGSYHGMSFDIGLDSTANHSDPAIYAADHALSPLDANYSHWTWNSGYIFIRLEGYVDTTAAANGTANAGFAYHVGMDSFRRTAELSFQKDFTGTSSQLELAIDWAKFLEGIDLTTELETHTTNNMSLATVVADNGPDAISVE